MGTEQQNCPEAEPYTGCAQLAGSVGGSGIPLVVPWEAGAVDTAEHKREMKNCALVKVSHHNAMATRMSPVSRRSWMGRGPACRCDGLSTSPH